jgi:predicted nucleic acid-binding Zn ribbon protein
MRGFLLEEAMPLAYALYYECEHCTRSWEVVSEDEFQEEDCEECGQFLEPKYAFPQLFSV